MNKGTTETKTKTTTTTTTQRTNEKLLIILMSER